MICVYADVAVPVGSRVLRLQREGRLLLLGLGEEPEADNEEEADESSQPQDDEAGGLIGGLG